MGHHPRAVGRVGLTAPLSNCCGPDAHVAWYATGIFSALFSGADPPPPHKSSLANNPQTHRPMLGKSMGREALAGFHLCKPLTGIFLGM